MGIATGSARGEHPAISRGASFLVSAAIQESVTHVEGVAENRPPRDDIRDVREWLGVESRR